MNQVATKTQTANVVVPAQNPVAVAKEAAPMKLAEEIEFRTEQFRGSLPAHIPVERFKKVLLVAVNSTPALVGADRRSFFNAALKAANDGLLPDGRDGALVIYNSKVKENGQDNWVPFVQWMPMIGGIRKKVRNSKEIKDWNAQVVYAKDHFEFELGDMPFIRHRPYMDGDAGPVIAAYSVAHFATGEISREVMTKTQIEKVRLSSKSKDKGPWVDWYEEMCRKTVARRHSKVLPMSTDLDDLMRRDDALYDFEGKSDKQMPETKRPQLSDFTAPKDAELPPAETVDTETGEVHEYSAADAHGEGAQAKADGKTLADMPINVKAFPNLAEAWEEGFNQEAE